MAASDPLVDDEIVDLLRPTPRELTWRVIDRWRDDPTLVRRAVLTVGAVVLVAGGLWWLLRPPAAPIESSIPRADASATSPGSREGRTDGGAASGEGAEDGADGGAALGAPDSKPPPTEMVVQAAGAVVRPGVYRLAAGSRVDDLVRRAGGMTADADADRVNLAAVVSDGERVWVPRRGELGAPPVVAGGGSGSGGAAGAGGSGSGGLGSEGGAPAVVDLNAATADQLDALPGVGPATATAILAYREANGPFRSVDDLLEVRGIGEAKLEQLRPLVRV